MQLELTVLPETFAVCRLSPEAPVPGWATTFVGSLSSITRTPDELSLVCVESVVPPDVKAERDWKSFRVTGPLDFQLLGILAALTRTLAEAGISLFALSTYDTDYILVRADKLDAAIMALTAAGQRVKR